MRLSRSKHYKVNMGNYEHVEFGSSVTIDHTDLGFSDEEVAKDPDGAMKELKTACEDYLQDQLAEEIKDAADLTDAEKSMLLDAFGSRRREKGRY